jgi:hypothetical protein
VPCCCVISVIVRKDSIGNGTNETSGSTRFPVLEEWVLQVIRSRNNAGGGHDDDDNDDRFDFTAY